MEQFVTGNRTFRQGFFRDHAALFEELGKGQHPLALYVGCSDSRVPIDLIAGAMPGDLFVVRTVGNIVPPSYYADACVGAAVEYAVDHLHVSHAIVCGHYGCGGIAAVVDEAAGHAHAFEPHLILWLGHARPILERLPEEQPDSRLRRAVEENVRQQMGHLRGYSCVAAAEGAGTLRLHGWVYDWDSGLLLEDRGDGVFRPLEE